MFVVFVLCLPQIDGRTNAKVSGIFLPDMPIQTAAFINAQARLTHDSYTLSLTHLRSHASFQYGTPPCKAYD